MMVLMMIIVEDRNDIVIVGHLVAGCSGDSVDGSNIEP